jgi:hypothetical protein
MHQLTIPLPPMWEAALGYAGAARFIAVYWDSVGDVAVVTNGWTTCDAWWDAFLGYIEHPAIAPSLAPYHLGSRVAPARQYLMLDRHERVLSVTTPAQAVPFLRSQPMPVEVEDAPRHDNPDEQLVQRCLTHQRSMVELADWLDQHAHEAGT